MNGVHRRLEMKDELLAVEKVKERLDRGEKLIFLETSAPEAWERTDCQIPGSRHVEPGQLQAQVRDFPSDAIVVTYAAGNSDEPSVEAARQLLGLGLRSVHALRGGLDAWREAGLPTERKHDSFPTH
jgi:rhodanese-related sulfurtransferase